MEKNELLLFLASRMKALRLEKRQTQEQVYDQTGIHIGRIEQGSRDVSYTTLVKLAGYFDVSVGYFDPSK